MSRRSSYTMVLTTSVMWVVRPTCGLVRCARSPMPVRLGVKTSWPASRSGPRTLRKPCAPLHAPCTKTNTAIDPGSSRHERQSAEHYDPTTGTAVHQVVVQSLDQRGRLKPQAPLRFTLHGQHFQQLVHAPHLQVRP